MKHFVIIIPGLGDHTGKVVWATGFWKLFDLTPIVFSMEWVKKGNNFKHKFNELIPLIDRLSKDGRVSLIGISAGSSVTVNAFFARTKKVYRVVNICGRLRKGKDNGYRSFEKMTKGHPGFAESVLTCEKNLEKIERSESKKIMTVRPLFGDEFVPPETAVVDGANNTLVPTGEHSFSNAMALTLFSYPIIYFLKS